MNEDKYRVEVKKALRKGLEGLSDTELKELTDFIVKLDKINLYIFSTAEGIEAIKNVVSEYQHTALNYITSIAILFGIEGIMTTEILHSIVPMSWVTYGVKTVGIDNESKKIRAVKDDASYENDGEEKTSKILPDNLLKQLTPVVEFDDPLYAYLVLLKLHSNYIASELIKIIKD